MQCEVVKAKQQEETLVLLLTEVTGNMSPGTVPSGLNHVTSKSIICLIQQCDNCGRCQRKGVFLVLDIPSP